MSTQEKRKQNVQQSFEERMEYDELLNCMRCGFCLPSCPTYLETNRNEAASPRGRIALIKGVVDGVIEPDQDFEDQLNMCLGCRACEPVCPSGVNYGHILEEARDILESNKKRSVPEKAVRWFAFDKLFPHHQNMVRVNNLLWFYQSSGMQSIVRKSGVMKLFPENMRTMEKVLPPIPKPSELKSRPTHLHAETEQKARVAFFSGCLMDTMFMKTNDATLTLLQKAGCEIVIPEDQACCGALHGHSGEKDSAKDLAKRNIEAFEALQVDYIILNAGGCGAFLVDYGHLLKDEPEWAKRAKAFSEKIKDISEILIEMEFHKKDLKLSNRIATYQDSCHLRNVMRTYTAPRKLLSSIEGVEFVELKEADHCCGSAGIYNLVQEEMSMQILDHKMERVKDISPNVLVTANPGCLLQMKMGIEREGLGDQMEAVHLVDLLLEAVPS
ncbi:MULTISPECIES: (Fe-S)-binding protein [Pontibacillus]|uniref:Glycolate oxidase iron-sulfur subunit n=1 Tax=Pontibacillus chungwhensis TaxID=265426 RepID=A0ABY8UXY8_9BACI|nr:MULTISPECIES: (Fe-S)-binding protein [Pontibacillus]MCD5325691.1 (Fe-S)-binding protein [Pontibacillus sp. HN14]WIF98068.1 (Fe-S)-binding protein [Pontibacillus chungwhensis]